jgi:nucleotide-binding universal stress UspA family protein
MESAMSYKTILVHVDDSARASERLELGFQLAADFDAHLVGLFALDAARIPSYALAEAGPMLQEIELRRRTEAAAAAESKFRQAERRAQVNAEWRLSMGAALPAVMVSARYADLVIAAQPEPRDPLAMELAGDFVLSAGRPVLFVPYAGRFASTCKRVLVAWNASREAARAVSDALPLLRRADSVEVVAFRPRPGDHGEVPGADIALFLARHGVKATAARQDAEIDIGAQILSRAADTSADLIVMGGYGHSQLRELVLGGVTRTMLEAMTVPVLMSH